MVYMSLSILLIIVNNCSIVHLYFTSTRKFHNFIYFPLSTSICENKRHGHMGIMDNLFFLLSIHIL